MERFRLLRSSVLQIFTVFLLLVTLSFVTAPTHQVYAQDAWRFQLPGASFDSCDLQQEINGECYVHRTLLSLMASFTCQWIFIPGICSNDPQHAMELKKQTLVWKSTEIIGATYEQKPASTYAFFRDMGQSLGFVPKQTYAQGVGFVGLAPLLPIWKVFRNIAYSLLAIVMIVIGFMVMLRKKIDPKTVVTVQNSLPRIVITMILITFSYAIVGIAIDLMYLVIALLATLLQGTGLLTVGFTAKLVSGQNIINPGSPQILYTQGNLMSVLSNINITANKLLFGVSDSFALNSLSSVITNTIENWTNDFFGQLGQSLANGVLAIGAVPFGSIFGIAMLYIFIRLTILFVGAYIQIVIALITAPLQILMEAFPGSTSFSNWLKNLISNIAVFPIGAAVFMLANVFGNFANSTTNTTLWLPPYTGIMGNTTSLTSLIGLGLLFALPSIAGSIKEALKAKPAINAGPGAILGPFGSGAGQIMQLGYQASFISNMFHAPRPSTPYDRQAEAFKSGVTKPPGGGGGPH